MTTDTMGGVWHYSLELAAGLCRRGIEVLLVAMGAAPTPEQRRLAALIPMLTLVDRPYRLEWMIGAEDDLAKAAAWLLELEAAFAPDIIHLNGYAHASLPWGGPVVVVCHSCVRSWWRAVHGADAPPQWDRYRDRVRAGLRAAHVVIAPTRAFLHDIEDIYGRLPAAMVIANGRSGPFAPAAEKESFVFSAGRLWDEAKGTGLLCRIAPRLPWPVVVAGRVEAPDGRAPSLGRAVRLAGVLEEGEMARLLAQAGIFALPARYEPFGLAVLEAAMSGCALVLGDIATLRELWGDAAIFVDVGDETSCLDALESVILNSPLRAEMGRRARNRALRYSVTAMVEAYVEAYGRALTLARAIRRAPEQANPNLLGSSA